MTKKEKVEKVVKELEKACVIERILWTNGCVYITVEEDAVDFLKAITARYGVKVKKISKCGFYSLCY